MDTASFAVDGVTKQKWENKSTESTCHFKGSFAKYEMSSNILAVQNEEGKKVVKLNQSSNVCENVPAFLPSSEKLNRSMAMWTRKTR